jgi:hypothetical protein
VRAIAIVNGTAPRLADRQRERIARALPGGVIVTRSLGEARGAIHAEIARGVDLIVLGGGDGTLVMGLTLIEEACRGAGRPEPAVGVLRLGAVNAIADAAGASDDPADDLARLARGEGTWRPMPMLRVLGLRAPFAGLGAGAQALEDRRAIGRLVDRVPVARRLVGSSARAALSAALRSAQRLAAPARPHAVISNHGAPAVEVVRGAPAGPEIAGGSDLWSGACDLIAGSTIPYLGVGARAFPLGAPTPSSAPGASSAPASPASPRSPTASSARGSPAGARADRFFLRCGDAGWPLLLRGEPAALRRDPPAGNARDFLCDHVQIHLSEETAVAVGGELLGRRRHVEIALGEPALIASLAPARG